MIKLERKNNDKNIEIVLYDGKRYLDSFTFNKGFIFTDYIIRKNVEYISKKFGIDRKQLERAFEDITR